MNGIDALKAHLWEKGFEDVDDIVRHVWDFFNFPQTGELLRLAGDMDGKITIADGEAKCYVKVTSGDNNVQIMNHLRGSGVCLFGVEQTGKTDENPNQLQIDEESMMAMANAQADIEDALAQE